MTDSLSIQTLLLSAGAAKRFGQAKQCVLIEGKALLVHTLELYSTFTPVLCVLGANNTEVSQLLPAGQERVLATQWQAGMGASIKAGIEALDGRATHICIALADQIGISSPELIRFFNEVEAFPQSIIAAGYRDVVGAPAVFPVRYATELAGLQGERGARSLLATHADNVRTVPMPGAAYDIDTQADLAAWLARQAQ